MKTLTKDEIIKLEALIGHEAKVDKPRTSCDCIPWSKSWGLGIWYYNTCWVCWVSYVTDIEKAMEPLEINWK